MAQYACILQEGQVADRRRAELAEGLGRIGRDAFGDGAEAAEILWMPVRAGFGFTAGEPSTSTLVVRSVPVGFPDDRREAFMKRVCALWVDVTGCSEDEIVVTAMDGPLPIAPRA